MSQQQASMMLMMHIIFMKLPNLVYKGEISIYENGSLKNENLQHHINEHEIDYTA